MNFEQPINEISADQLQLKLKAAAEKVARLKANPENQKHLEFFQPPAAPLYSTSVNQDGQLILHLDKKTQIFIKPDQDPDQIYYKYIKREI